jgi:hypothetical protein
MDTTAQHAYHWRRVCVGFLAGCSLIVLLCLLGSFAIAQGQIVGPGINVQFGPYHVLSRITTTPDCHPLSMGCVAAAAQPVGGARGYYTIWVLTLSEQPIAGGLQEDLNSARVLTLPIAPSEPAP